MRIRTLWPGPYSRLLILNLIEMSLRRQRGAWASTFSAGKSPKMRLATINTVILRTFQGYASTASLLLCPKGWSLSAVTRRE